jgi:hypothetical protein
MWWMAPVTAVALTILLHSVRCRAAGKVGAIAKFFFAVGVIGPLFSIAVLILWGRAKTH